MWHRMKPTMIFMFIIACLVALMGCAGPAEQDITEEPPEPPPQTETPSEPPTPTSTPDQPTSEATREHPHASANVVYQTADNTLMSYISATGEAWVFTGMNFPISFPPPSPISAFETNLYALASQEDGQPYQVFEITPVMTRPLTINAQGEPRSIAVTVEPGTPNIWLAVGVIDRSTDPYTSRLVLQIIDAADAQVVAEQAAEEMAWYAPVRWSSDAQRLYYSQEPEGLGGYILFDGWSSLYVYDVATATSNTLIPIDPTALAICLDDLSPDEQWVAHHCEPRAGIGLINVAAGEQEMTIAPPEEIAGEVGQTGSARFSPDGSRIAFALARGNPDQEQGWVAVTDDLSGTSRLLMTGEANHYYGVRGWLDDQTLVVQEYSADGGLMRSTMLWLVPIDGGEAQLIGEGRFIALIPALVP